MKSTKKTIRYISDTKAQVSKEFEKKARIFGTEEYKLWKAYREDFPEAKMVTKSIKTNSNKKTYKNLKYANMEGFIREQDNAADLLREFQKQIRLSKIQKNPYRAVLAWFLQKFEGYDSYKDYFAKLEAEAEEAKAAAQTAAEAEEAKTAARTAAKVKQAA